VEDSSAVPDIVGLLLVVEVLLAGLVITGLAGATESMVMRRISDAGEVLPAASLAFAVIE